jgi:hypothetical protein
VRASFIRFLALGGDHQAPVHENGVMLSGAWIDGIVNLDFCSLTAALRLEKCRLERLVAHACQMPGLTLTDSVTEHGINAMDVNVSGSILLDGNFRATGRVNLLGAKIGGSLECSGGQFEDNSFLFWADIYLKDTAIILDNATIGGSIFFRHGFVSKGRVQLVSTKIGGNFDCSHGSFDGTENGFALVADNSTIDGNVYFSMGFEAKGEVRLAGTVIKGNLECNYRKFENQYSSALSCYNTIIKGDLQIDEDFKIIGNLFLIGTKIGQLVDSEACWPDEGQLFLDGIQIGRFTGSAPTSGESRVRWLQLQSPMHLKHHFKPQPWEETIRVLREMGHNEDSRIVAIAKQDQLHNADPANWRHQWRRPFSTQLSNGTRARFSLVGWLLHGAWGRLAGYGYQPLKLVGWMVLVWLIGSGAFWLGMKGGYMAPTSPIVVTDIEIDAACDAGPNAGDKSWTLCKELPDEYSTFQPMAYSLDLILPVISLQQDTEWAPVVGDTYHWYWWGIGLRGLMWFIILFGWVASLMLVAILTNLVKKD